MKTLSTLFGMTVTAGLLLVGCSQSETACSVTEETASQPNAEEGVSMPETVTQAVETAQQVIRDTNDKAQEILTQAKALVSEQKYEEATSLLQKLSDFKLTPEQQKMVDDLKATIQKAMQSEAVKQGTKAIGNMLGGEKN